MGMKSRRKGRRIELEILKAHQDAGLRCSRAQPAGDKGGVDKPDLLIEGAWRAEVKARAGGQGFKNIEDWLGDLDLLFLRRDGRDPLVAMPWATYLRLMEKWGGEV